MSTEDDLDRIGEREDRDFQTARFRRALADAQAVFDALASQGSPTALRNAVIAIDETSAKRALIVAAVKHRNRVDSADEHFNWMRSDGELGFDVFDLD